VLLAGGACALCVPLNILNINIPKPPKSASATALPVREKPINVPNRPTRQPHSGAPGAEGNFSGGACGCWGLLTVITITAVAQGLTIVLPAWDETVGEKVTKPSSCLTFTSPPLDKSMALNTPFSAIISLTSHGLFPYPLLLSPPTE